MVDELYRKFLQKQRKMARMSTHSYLRLTIIFLLYKAKVVLNLLVAVAATITFIYVFIRPALTPPDSYSTDDVSWKKRVPSYHDMRVTAQPEYADIKANVSEEVNVVVSFVSNDNKQECSCPDKVPINKAEVPGIMKKSSGAYPDPKTPIRILSWTQLWGKQLGPWFQEGRAIFDKCGFDPPLACEYTHDRAMYDRSDAVLFHGFWIKDFPKYRSRKQKWIFWEYESPRIVDIMQNLTDYSGVFNITSTYTLDSDVPLPFLRKCVPSPNENNVRPPKDGNYAAGKTKQVAWFVSHCQTPSKRENYAKELQKYISVDIYGACGPFKCDRADREKCDRELENNYKFYLAFENSLCRDYVTEKLWDIFDHRLNIIPIVLGEADYSNILPEGTYINVQDFESPEQLAAYLNHIDQNDEEYNEYIRKRKFDHCRYTTPYRHYHCGLCEHLHAKRGQQEIALDIAGTWKVEQRCRSAGSFYNKIAPNVVNEQAPIRSNEPN